MKLLFLALLVTSSPACAVAETWRCVTGSDTTPLYTNRPSSAEGVRCSEHTLDRGSFSVVADEYFSSIVAQAEALKAVASASSVIPKGHEAINVRALADSEEIQAPQRASR